MATARALALPASTLSSSRFQIKLFKDPTCQNRMLLLACHYNHRASGTYSLKLQTRAEFSVSHKVKMQMTKVKERLLEDVPDFMKDFPWKKAEDMVLHKFLFLGQKALKWSFLTLFIFSSLSDIIFAISRNKELMIPLGLFAGCMLADFLKEISQELVDNSEVYFAIVPIYVSSYLLHCSLLVDHVICSTGKSFETAICGYRLLFCSCEVYCYVFCATGTGISLTCCKWWADASFVAMEVLTGRTEQS
ncbi:uncharacterized protein LOC131161944 isoform X1 [Malania oleifera]|uniref:uncharacterized protein LOC131161944 isoform X1 n=1 Tax=Malania oleifera TaxID=397392 RepID=UPI0025AE6C85|nr:uncharacterized protein LOC131161944 isoform X1 [Malania oleifera]